VIVMRAFVLALTLVGAQQAAPKPAFEVATIKRNVSLAEGGTIGMEPGGRFRAVNTDLRFMIATMYRTGPRLFASQIIGLPAWATTERWDITAKVTSDLMGQSPQELFRKMPPMVQSLLEDRFQLRLHHDTQPQPTYALVVARRDGTMGPRFRPTTIDCVKEYAKCQIQSTPGRYSAVGVTIPTLMILLSNTVERVVVDRTGLKGSFDVDLEWSSEPGSDKPSIFTAVQEQLGLKLQFERNPVDVVIIDNVERPTED
jgi:bla regulator protein blaR1